MQNPGLTWVLLTFCVCVLIFVRSPHKFTMQVLQLSRVSSGQIHLIKHVFRCLIYARHFFFQGARDAVGMKDIPYPKGAVQSRQGQK